MRLSHTWRWFLALLLGTGFAGCKSSSGQSYPADPLLVSKRPVEVKARTAPPTQIASANFIVPPSRVDLIASRKDSPGDRPTSAKPPQPTRLHPTSTDPNPTMPGSRQLPSPAVRAASE